MEDIEKSYKKLIRLYHPLRRKGSTKRFMEIKEAYLILSDKYKRNYYNIFGDAEIGTLSHNRTAYLMTRLYDRANIVIFAIFSLLLVLHINAVPILYYYFEKLKITHLHIVAPLVLFTGFLLVPIIRGFKNTRKMVGLNEFVDFKMIFIAFLFLNFLHLFILGLQKSNVVNAYIAVRASFFLIETLKLILCYLLGKVDVTKSVGVWRSLVNFVIFNIGLNTCLLNTPAWAITVILFALYVTQTLMSNAHLLANIIVYACKFMYVLTLLLICLGWKSMFIFIPHAVFICIVLFMSTFLIRYFKKAIPSSSYSSKVYLYELECLNDDCLV